MGERAASSSWPLATGVDGGCGSAWTWATGGGGCGTWLAAFGPPGSTSMAFVAVRMSTPDGLVLGALFTGSTPQ